MKIYNQLQQKFIASLIIIALVMPMVAFALPKAQDYPHWNVNNKQQYAKLVQIDKFIVANKNRGYVAVFDWDGTLYSEQITSKHYRITKPAPAEEVWQLWLAAHLNSQKYQNFFPLYKTADGKQQQNVIEAHNFIYSTNNLTRNHDRVLTHQIATFTAGITPEQLQGSINAYLADFSVSKYAFLPMLDIMQRLVDNGFQVWIVTAGDPYFVAAFLAKIEQNIAYRPGQKYNFHIAHKIYNPAVDHIVGDGVKLSPDGKFTVVYEDRFMQDAPGEAKALYVSDGIGKKMEIKYYIEQHAEKPVVFCAGNSGGDMAMVQYVLDDSSHSAMCLAVNPRGGLEKLLTQYSKRLLSIHVG
ncbi:MAG: hypothetical protein KAT71_04505 [Gammaproteobacteria bacterium]|nr:hypothetical protein [Gammaproteobacteria bacterium]